MLTVASGGFHKMRRRTSSPSRSQREQSAGTPRLASAETGGASALAHSAQEDPHFMHESSRLPLVNGIQYSDGR